jgi:hypothetical protein
VQDTNLKECDENLPIKVREAFDEFVRLFDQASSEGYSIVVADEGFKTMGRGYSGMHYYIYLSVRKAKDLKLSISKTTTF